MTAHLFLKAEEFVLVFCTLVFLGKKKPVVKSEPATEISSISRQHSRTDAALASLTNHTHNSTSEIQLHMVNNEEKEVSLPATPPAGVSASECNPPIVDDPTAQPTKVNGDSVTISVKDRLLEP